MRSVGCTELNKYTIMVLPSAGLTTCSNDKCIFFVLGLEEVCGWNIFIQV